MKQVEAPSGGGVQAGLRHADGHLEKLSCFSINGRLVDRLQKGRVFLGEGDAAHIHSPAGDRA